MIGRARVPMFPNEEITPTTPPTDDVYRSCSAGIARLRVRTLLRQKPAKNKLKMNIIWLLLLIPKTDRSVIAPIINNRYL